MGIILWLLIGALAGFLAGKIFKGKGFGIIINIIVGIVGGWLGGWLFGVLGFHFLDGLIGSLITATVGAIVLLWILSLFKKK
jgi:uncharacterized membrane protein YeaQ/YmgE (transglycosylase-associated protein family)